MQFGEDEGEGEREREETGKFKKVPLREGPNYLSHIPCFIMPAARFL